MAIGDGFIPVLGQPSLTRSEVISLYTKYGINDYTENDIASDLENANKYSAVGIEGQIAKRATNVPGTGYAPVPIIPVINATPPATPPSVVGNVLANGPTANTTSPVGPTGPIIAVQGPGVQGVSTPADATRYAAPASGISSTTILIGVAVLGAAAFLLLRHRR